MDRAEILDEPVMEKYAEWVEKKKASEGGEFGKDFSKNIRGAFK